MEHSFELNEDDLTEVQAQLIVLRREALQSSPVLFVAVAALVGLTAWALVPLFTSALTLPRFFVIWVGAALLALLLTPQLSRVRSARLDRWSARRMARAAVKQSVLGAVTVQLGDKELVRRNSAGELRVAWSQVQDLLVSPGLLTLRLRGSGRVLLLPTRALTDLATTRALLERCLGQPGIDVDLERSTTSRADPSGKRVPRRPARALMRPALLTLLALSLLALGFQRWHLWSNDPRRTNPPGKVVLYATDWCPACAKLRTCLQRHDVPFEERDVDRSAQAEAEWAALDGTGIPVTLVGQRVLYGLDPAELKEALAEVSYTVDCEATARRVP